jgi:nucleotide-binding universal stress UspA family protein
MFKKILLPSDGSEAALHATREVASLVTAKGEAQITVLVVILPLDTENTDFDLEFVEAHNAQVRRQAEIALEKTTRTLAEFGVPHTGKILEGNPASAVIAREAECGDYDVIAMSSRGMGMQTDKLRYMGSVTEHVIRRVHVPVLVLPIGEP